MRRGGWPTPAAVLGSRTLQELLAIQASDGPKNLGFFGTRNMGITHQKLVEILSYAMVSTVGSRPGQPTQAAGLRADSCCCQPAAAKGSRQLAACQGQQLSSSS